MVNIIIEGARGMGKSTVVGRLRSNRMERVSINHTGLNTDDLDTKDKMLNYYNSFISFLEMTKDNRFDFIHDRFFISEMVMNKIYKTNYTFHKEGLELAKKLDKVGRTLIISLEDYDIENIKMKLSSDSRKNKANLFEDDKILDDAENSLRQQEIYQKIFTEINDLELENIEIIQLDIGNLTLDEVVDLVENTIELFKVRG